MLYRNARTGELYDSPGGRDGRLEAIADDQWLPVDTTEAATPFVAWTPPPTLADALAALPPDEMDSP